MEGSRSPGLVAVDLFREVLAFLLGFWERNSTNLVSACSLSEPSKFEASVLTFHDADFEALEPLCSEIFQVISCHLYMSHPLMFHASLKHPLLFNGVCDQC